MDSSSRYNGNKFSWDFLKVFNAQQQRKVRANGLCNDLVLICATTVQYTSLDKLIYTLYDFRARYQSTSFFGFDPADDVFYEYST